MTPAVLTGLFSLLCWAAFLFAFHRDRSRYRNCYLLFLALLSLFPFLLNVLGEHGRIAAVVIADTVLVCLLIVPFFLMVNGIIMLRKEGLHAAHLLSLVLGIVVFLGEAIAGALVFAQSFSYGPERTAALYRSGWFLAGTLLCVSVIYVSMAFVIFMLYTLFLQVIPKKRDFDYVIIHGAGLLQGDRLSRLLRDRLDKAVAVYHKDPTPPKLIPSGGKGEDEKLSEAEAMARYLRECGIPEEDILTESESKTTFENILFSKRILDAQAGPKYTALVTSNYHVYRALRYCKKVGLSCTGIGSRVAFYYWPSALIREFIAIHAERKHAVMFFAGWLLCMLGVLWVFLLQ